MDDRNDLRFAFHSPYSDKEEVLMAVTDDDLLAMAPGLLRLLLTDPCPTCGGGGYYDGPSEMCGCWDADATACSRHACPSCGGRGWTAKPELVERIVNDLMGATWATSKATIRIVTQAVLEAMLEVDDDG